MSGGEAQFPRGTFLAGLPASAREALLELGTSRRYEPATVLLREGEHTSHVLVLLEGLVKITATS